MKKKTLLFLIFILSFCSASFGQAFKKNNVVLSGGVGVGVGYAYQNYSPYDYDMYSSYYTPRLNYALGVMFPFALEYALHDKIGLGLSFAENSYINTDINKATITNFGIFGAFHFLSRERIELYTRLNAGLSSMAYSEADNYRFFYDSSYVNGPVSYNMKGMFVKPSFGLRVYFSKHVGIFADAGVGIHSLNTNKFNTPNGTHAVIGRRVRVTMVGLEITTGLAFKF